MPVTATNPTISLSSSGYADGLGRRQLEVDRETGAMIERLVVRPELTAFEHALAARVARGSLLKDERFARPRRVAWDDEGRLTVTSDYVGGRRLSDVIDLAAAAGVIPGIDAAIGLLLELLPALSFLHSETMFAHGVLGAGRLTVTPAGTLIVLDWVYGATVEHLQLTRQRLWDELGVAAHPSPGPPRLDQASDLTQAAMIAASLVVGRPLCDNDYPSGIPALRSEIADVAQIRGNQEFSRGIERFFDRSLPIRPRRVFSSADEALFELRLLVRNSIGVEPCCAAFREFLHEAEAVDPERIEVAPKYQGPSHEHRIDDQPKPAARAPEPTKTQPVPVVKGGGKTERQQPAPIRVERFELERIAVERVEQERLAREESERAGRERAETERFELERLERERAIKEAEELQRLAREKAEADRLSRERAEAERAARERAEAELHAAEQAEADRRARERAELERQAQEQAAANRIAQENAETERPGPEAGAARGSSESPDAAADSGPAAPVEATLEISLPIDLPSIDVPDEPLVHSDTRRRRKKDRSARARKDRLHSASARTTETPPAEKKSGGSWLVRPDRAAAFEPPAPQIAPKTIQQAAASAGPSPASTSGPEPAAVVAPPAAAGVAPAAPAASSPNTIDLPASTPGTPPIAVAQPAATPAAKKPETGPKFQTIKLKTPQGRPHGTIRRAPAPSSHRTSIAPLADDIYGVPDSDLQEGRRGIPWKTIAAAAVILMGGGYAALSFWSAPAAKASDAPVAAATAASAPAPAKSGGLEITTQPAGARVLLDGKAAGESPVTLDSVAPGRHTVTVVGEAGTVKRMVKVEAGAVAKLEVSVFSGFAAISAPIVLDVSENGRGLGTTENHIMLTPGHHELQLANKDLQYSTTATVDVEPGEVKQVKLEPKGAANINAQPWAEVWIDGAKVGETPLANLPLTLGSREIVFRNPQFGDRKVIATITAGAAANISVDFSKQ